MMKTIINKGYGGIGFSLLCLCLSMMAMAQPGEFRGKRLIADSNIYLRGNRVDSVKSDTSNSNTKMKNAKKTLATASMVYDFVKGNAGSVSGLQNVYDKENAAAVMNKNDTIKIGTNKFVINAATNAGFKLDFSTTSPSIMQLDYRGYWDEMAEIWGLDYGLVRHHIHNANTPTTSPPGTYIYTTSGYVFDNDYGNQHGQLFVGAKGNAYADSAMILDCFYCSGINIAAHNSGYITFKPSIFVSGGEYGRFAPTTGHFLLNTATDTTNRTLVVNGPALFKDTLFNTGNKYMNSSTVVMATFDTVSKSYGHQAMPGVSGIDDVLAVGQKLKGNRNIYGWASDGANFFQNYLSDTVGLSTVGGKLAGYYHTAYINWNYAKNGNNSVLSGSWQSNKPDIYPSGGSSSTWGFKTKTSVSGMYVYRDYLGSGRLMDYVAIDSNTVRMASDSNFVEVKSGRGIEYKNNYGSTLVARSLVDKNYVDSLVSGSGGGTNTSIGSAYKVAVDATKNIKSLANRYGLILDSTTSGQVGFSLDTSIAVNKTGAQVIPSNKTFTGQINFGGVTSSFTNLSGSGTDLALRLADNSAYASLIAAGIKSGANTFNLATTNATTVNIAGANAAVVNFAAGTSGAETRWKEPSGSGTNYFGLKAQAMAADQTYLWPAAVGAAGSILTDAAGNGTLTWSSPGWGLIPGLKVDSATVASKWYAKHYTDSINALNPLVYIATLTQTSNHDPVDNVIKNTTGASFTWEYLSTGNYRITTGAEPFTTGRTIVTLTLGGSSTANDGNAITFTYDGSSLTTSTIYFFTTYKRGFSDDILENATVKIEIYP